MRERPFSCNLNNAEVFSCVLGREEESSLSIIDPVTINFEIGASRSSGGARASKGLLDLADSEEGVERTAEVQLQQLNVRLSYHDTLMFRAILASFPRQARQAMSGREAVQESGRERSPPSSLQAPSNVQAQTSQLMTLGFSREDCSFALSECRGQVNDAALWLTQNASPVKKALCAEPVESNQVGCYLQGSSVSFTSVELKTSSINICIIDDCKDADVPLIETTLSHLHLKHGFSGEGEASSLISGLYFNRALSSWEPFLDPWRCSFDWRLRRIGPSNGQKLSLNMVATDVVNFTLTSTLVELYQMVKANWTEDYYNMQGPQQGGEQIFGFRRRRTPFVPFALINSTGCPLWFCTQTRMSGSQFGPSRDGCQMAIAIFLDRMSLALRASGLWLRYAAKFDPFLSLDCTAMLSTLAQSKERKGSNFAIWQPCEQDAGAVGRGDAVEARGAGRDAAVPVREPRQAAPPQHARHEDPPDHCAGRGLAGDDGRLRGPRRHILQELNSVLL